jgi:predicted transcriptional regulator
MTVHIGTEGLIPERRQSQVAGTNGNAALLMLGVYKRTQGMPMPSSTTLTVRLHPEVKQRLDRLADATRRTKSFLAAEAIAAYVAREAEIIDGIRRGMDDLRAGRLASHDQAIARLEATISSAERNQG